MAMPISAEAKEDLQEMDLLPHMHIMADRSREKVRTQQTQEIVVPYAQSCLSAKSEGSDTFKIAYEISNHCDF